MAKRLLRNTVAMMMMLLQIVNHDIALAMRTAITVMRGIAFLTTMQHFIPSTYNQHALKNYQSTRGTLHDTSYRVWR